jgi:integrase
MDNAKLKKLLDQVRETLRVKHYAYRTEEAYVDWIRRYMLFHEKRHPQDMAEAEVLLTTTEVQKLLQCLEGTHQLLAKLLYGTGPRVKEGLRLRV